MNLSCKVAQIGTFDYENFGDLLFPTVLTRVLDSSGIKVDLFSPYGGPMPFNQQTCVHPISKLEDMIRSEKYLAIVIGGGDLIRMDHSIASTYEQIISNSLLLWQWPVILSKKYGIPAIFNAPGVPFEFPQKCQRVVKCILENVDYVTVRDETSKFILESCGIKNIKVVPDTIFYINHIIPKETLVEVFDSLKKRKLIPDIENYIVFQHNKAMLQNKEYVHELRSTIHEISRADKIMFMPIGYVHQDSEFMERIYEGGNKSQSYIKDKLTPTEMLAVISKSKGFIGTSMHGIVTSFAYEKSIIILNPCSLTKVNGVADITKCKDANIKDIEDLLPFYKTSFNNYKATTKAEIDTKIKDHLQTIINLSKEPREKDSSDFDIKFMSLCEDCIINPYEVNKPFKVYYDKGKGFSEEEMTSHFYPARINKIKKSINITQDINAIRIDPVEDEMISIDKISITSEGRDIPYAIEDLMQINGKSIVLSFDPKIIIPATNLNTIKIEIEFNILDPLAKDQAISQFLNNKESNSNLPIENKPNTRNLLGRTIKMSSLFKKLFPR